ncbi:MAG TPA: class I SAM-dependent methyltransferase [Gaiellaceae bacterium]|nr:class I SAM-dependent methyltransferase [Gaiellaceae bacterium]
MPPLDKAHDAYGQLLLAVLEGRDCHEITERDDGFVYAGDPSEYLAPYRKWPATEKRAFRFVRGHVLDVGCGAGRAALALQEKGLDVVAIDESPLAVEVARRRGVLDARALSLADVGPELGVFDTVLILRNNMGLAGTDAAGRHLLERLHTLTSERGRIVTDSVDPTRLPPEHRRTAGRRIRVRFQSYASPWFRYAMVAPEEVEPLVRGTGWRVARMLDDGSPRYGIVLEKS